VDSLIGIKLFPHADPGKGKSPVVYEKPMPSGSVITVSEEIRWKPPELGWNKLSTDGSFDSSGNAGAGMILRDHRGIIIFSACRTLYSYRDALEAELCVCMEGISVAIQWSDLPILLEMDSLEAVAMISCDIVDHSVYASIVNDIKHLISLRQTRISHIVRSRNKASDCLAGFART